MERDLSDRKKTHSLYVHFGEINVATQSVESKLLDHFFAVPIEIIFPGESSQRDQFILTDSVGKKKGIHWNTRNKLYSLFIVILQHIIISYVSIERAYVRSTYVHITFITYNNESYMYI